MPTPEPRFTAPPRSDVVERAASTIAFAFFIGAWVVAYVGIVPGDAARYYAASRTAGKSPVVAMRLDASRQVVADGRVRP